MHNDLSAERLMVQLAGCGVAALGGTSSEQVATRDQYGWSRSYQDVLNLRMKYEAALAAMSRALGNLDDPTGGTHVEDMRRAADHLRTGLASAAIFDS